MRAFAAGALMLVATPALATGEIVCSGKGASIDLLVGRTISLYIDRAMVTVGDKTWTSSTDLFPGTEIVVGQAFEDGQQLLVDLAGSDTGEVLIRLRVFKASDGDKSAAGGVLSVKGEGVFVVDCSEPQ